MPYQGELANKASHADIVKNPDVNSFLEKCRYLRQPTDEDILRISKSFSSYPQPEEKDLPEYLIATDGSYYEASVNNRFPNTKVAYLKFGTILIKLSEYRALHFQETNLLDPFKVAALEEKNTPITLTLPSANVTVSGMSSVQESFRHILNEWFCDSRTQIDEEDATSSLIDTLFDLASRRPDNLGSGNIDLIRTLKCPTCGVTPDSGFIEVKKGCKSICDSCNHEIFPTDCLRIWEEISEYQSNGTALGRIMMIVEHLLPIHYIRYLKKYEPEKLSNIVFFVDGPLAVFGNCAWIHRCILDYLNEVRRDLLKQGLNPPLIIGLQKSGQLVDFAQLVSPELKGSSLLLIDDEYRYKYIYAGREMAGNGFGDETYYGQDFIYKTPSGRIFVFGLPFPTGQKRPRNSFDEKRFDLNSYVELNRALSVLFHFESDLYENALVPIALAHKYTAISLSPGGRVLDLLSRASIGAK
ncbi:DNA double-strand break repair nuclease NurA [Bdellovibrio sp. HCB185ZH]|uniref:DNA double-strand break repair nuclease NurA n=1 Tax=Bdellovibrio sp. HCB185ZH TaxID=3394235 RepID=UPI0039A64682